MLADIIFFKRYLYADGACIFLSNYNLGVHFEIPSRIVGQILLKTPIILSQLFNIDNLLIAEKIFALGFFFPFLISFILIQIFRNDYKNIGYFSYFLTLSIIYIPYSFFPLGEYNLIYPLIPLIVASFYQLKDYPEDLSARLIFNISIFILTLSYDIFPFFSILLIFLFYYQQYKSKKISYFIPEFGSLIIACLALLSIKLSLPPLVAVNGLKGIFYYGYIQPDGYIYDSQLYFILAIFFVVVIFFLFDKKNKSQPKKPVHNIVVYILLAVFCFLANVANHYPSNSYFSKPIFLSVLIFFALFVLFFNKETFDNFIKFSLGGLFIIFLINSSFMFFYANEYKSYLKKFKKNIEIYDSDYILQDEFVLSFKDDKRFYKQRFNYFPYDWSWGHSCLSQIVKPKNSSYVVGHCDPKYYISFPDKVPNFNEDDSDEYGC